MHVGQRVSRVIFFFFQAEDGIRDVERSRGLGDVYKRQLSLILELIVSIPHMTLHERKIGTLRFLAFSLITCFSIQLAHAIVGGIAIYIFSSLTLPSFGLLPLVLCEVMTDCLKNQEENKRILFINAHIKAQYYPWLLFVLFLIFTQFQIIPLLAGIGLGYVHFNKYLDFFFNFSNEKVQACENYIIFGKLKEFFGFIAGRDAQDYSNAIEQQIRAEVVLPPPPQFLEIRALDDEDKEVKEEPVSQIFGFLNSNEERAEQKFQEEKYFLQSPQ
eukprot:TRINITY_DN36000_c0_g1_i1.p1 TRINITY_DN36000_c0_g1~~TRINITY_DN36000_c0_g1_i1.p1  ORF type:complete len:273 (-),score=51.36 TRINITY_DN36000_c0_g1_i1:34-852(-)